MAEEKDNDSEKTEQPTSHRLDEAFKRGKVALSREVTHWFMLGTAALLLVTIVPFLSRLYMRSFKVYIQHPDQWLLDPMTMLALLHHITLDFFLILLPLILFFLVAAIAAGLLQTRLSISYESLKPQFSRLSPLSGLKRLFAKKALIEFLKGLVKLSLITYALYAYFVSKVKDIPALLNLPIETFLLTLSGYIFKALIIVVIYLTIIAILDYCYQKYEFIKTLKMTKDEVKKEYKNQEGDPQIKSRRRQIAQQRIKHNLMESMGRATAVITNPTHYAIAIQYDHETMDAPVVVAKGLDFVALRIKELANDFKVPIIENPPLARALHASVEIDQEIPPEHYKAVAEVIRFVMLLKKQQF